MGKTSRFLEYSWVENPYRDIQLQLKDYTDFHVPRSADIRHYQAARCMNCDVPFCHSDFGCPLHNLIPEWNDLLYQGQEREALKRLMMTVPSRRSQDRYGRLCVKKRAISRMMV